MEGVADTPEGLTAIQTDLSALEKWVDRILVRFNNKEKCKVLHVRRNRPTHKCRLESAAQPESCLVGKALGVLMNIKLNISQQCDLDATQTNGKLGCVRQVIATM